VLTTVGGLKYLIDVDDGLLEVEQLSGNKILFTDTGIYPDYGIGVTWTRDGQGRIDQMQLADGTAIDYGYDPVGDLVAVTDQAGDVVEFVYDDDHRLISYNDKGYGPVAINTYDADGRLVGSQDPGGAFLSMSHDLTAWTTTVVGPDPRLTTVTHFNADGLTERVVQDVVMGPGPGKVGDDEGLHREWSWEYDDAYNVISEQSPDGDVEEYGWDDDGNMAWAEDAEGNETEWTYDDYGNVLEVITNDDSAGLWIYNEEGKLIEVLSSTGETLYTLTYDADGFLHTVTDADGITVVVTVDGDGEVTDVGIAGVDVSASSDAMSRIETGTDAAGNVTRVEYDERGALLALVDANGGRQEWAYDDRGLLVNSRDKAGRETLFTWDDNGRLTEVVTRTGDVVHYSYDVLGQLVRIDGGDVYLDIAYDALGRVIALGNAAQFIDFEWGIEDELLQMTSSGITMDAYPVVSHDYVWSPAGFLDAVISPYGTIQYVYDNQGRPKTQEDSLGGTVDYVWSEEGRLLTLERQPSGLVTQYTYTDAGRLERTMTQDDLVLIQDDTLAYNVQGYITTATDQYGPHDYDYDVLGQLTSADHPAASGIPDELYTYDAIGNRTSWTGHVPGEIVYDAEGRLVQDADYLYTYDARGRLVVREDRDAGYITEYHWNAFSQLVRIVNADGTETKMAYDPLGRRVEIDDDGDITRFGWDGGEIRMLFDETNTLTSWESTDIFGELMSKYDAIAGTTEQSLLNHMGTMTGRWDGATTSWDPRDSFGNPVGGASALSPHALTWHSQDPSGLIYARNRYLDPKSGRFISQDPILATNEYAYALNNPLTYWDPYGLTAAQEEGQKNSLISLTIRDSLRELGEELACQFFTDASLVTFGTSIPGNLACAILSNIRGGCKGKKCGGGCKGKKCGGGGCSSFVSDTVVPATGGERPIDEIASGDRVIAQSDSVPHLESVATVCDEQVRPVARHLAADEVLAYDSESGDWVVRAAGTLGGGVAYIDGGVLVRGGAVVGAVRPEDLRSADATYDVDGSPGQPCMDSWVLRVRPGGEVSHMRLSDVGVGERFAYQGRLMALRGSGQLWVSGEVLGRVVGTTSREAPTVLSLTLQAPDGSSSVVQGTPEHPIYLQDEGRYVSLRRLERGMSLQTEGGASAEVVRLSEATGPVRVYNFEVEGVHNYFVQAWDGTPVLVHNSNCTKPECFVAGTEVSSGSGGRPIESLDRGDRVMASDRASGGRVEVGAPRERVAVTLTEGARTKAKDSLRARAATWVRRAVAAGCVAGACQAMAFDATTGVWEDAAFSIAVDAEELLGPDGHLYRVTDDGLVDRGVVDDFEALVGADVAIDEAWDDGAPAWDDWVWVLGDDDEAGHHRLLDVAAGDWFAWQGRVFDLRVGDDRAWEIRDAGQVLARVTETFKRMAVDEVIDLEVAYPDGSVEVLTGTHEHPFWVEAEQAWVPLGKLAEGDVLTTDGGGEAVVVGLTVKPGSNEVFNIEVAGPHNYFVRADGSDGPGVLVHNKEWKTPEEWARCDAGAILTRARRASRGGQKSGRGGDFFNRAATEVFALANQAAGQGLGNASDVLPEYVNALRQIGQQYRCRARGINHR